MALSRVNRPRTVSGLCLTAALALAVALAAPASAATASVTSGSATWRNVNITAGGTNGRGIQYASTANAGGR